MKSGVMEVAGARWTRGAARGGGVNVIALMVLRSCLLYMLPSSGTGDTMAGPGTLVIFTGVRLKTIPSLPVAGVRSNVARGSAVKLVLRPSKPESVEN